MSSAAMPQAPPTENIFGIAKKMSLELEKFPLHTHATIVNMLRMTVEHRKVELDNEVAMANHKAQEAAMDDARRAHAEKMAQDEQRIAAQMIKANAEKAPRMSIVLGEEKAETQPAQELVATQ